MTILRLWRTEHDLPMRQRRDFARRLGPRRDLTR
jgi:hypothetical protein